MAKSIPALLRGAKRAAQQKRPSKFTPAERTKLKNMGYSKQPDGTYLKVTTRPNATRQARTPPPKQRAPRVKVTAPSKRKR